MVSPNIVAESWWANVSASDLSAVMKSIIIDPISAAIMGVSENGRGMGVISRADFPADLTTVLDDAGSSQLRRGYLATFHAWLEANPASGDTDRHGPLTLWPLITGDTQSSDKAKRKAELKIRAKLINKLDDRFQQYRQAMFTACSQVRLVMEDEKVTGKLKKGRLVLDHAADPRTKKVKSHGKTMYRTPEGYLARKVGVFGQGARARDDWNIMVSRAVLHQQTTLATDAMVSKLVHGTDGDSMFELATDVRATAVDLLSRCWGSEFRSGLNSTIEGWSVVSGPPASNFAEIPAYAVERLSGTKEILQTREAELRNFNTDYVAFRTKWNTSNDQPSLADELRNLLNAAVMALQNFWNALRDLIDCQVEVSQRFYDWLTDWTKEQQRKGFRTLHPELWVALKITKITLMTAGLAASIALSVLSLGTVAPFVALGVAAASILLDKFEDYVIDKASEKDLEGLDEDGLAEKYLGEGFVTAQEKALGGALHLYQRAKGSTATKEERRERVEDALERMEQGVEAIEFFDENRERLETGVKVLSAIGQLAVQAKDAEQALQVKEGMEQILHVVGPMSLAGATAETATAGAVGGLKLGIEVIGDTITYFVPPELKDLVSKDIKLRLTDAFDMAKSELHAQEEEALKGQLRSRAKIYAEFTFDGSSVKAKIVDANGDAYKVSVNDRTLRPMYKEADAFKVVMKTYQSGSSGWADSYGMDAEKYILVAMKDERGVAKDNYDPESDGQPAIVRFRKANLLNVVEEDAGEFVCEDVDGTLLKQGGHAWVSLPSAYTVTITADGKGYYEGPSAGPKLSAKKSKQLNQVKKLKDAVDRKKGKELVSS